MAKDRYRLLLAAEGPALGLLTGGDPDVAQHKGRLEPAEVHVHKYPQSIWGIQWCRLLPTTSRV
jgi:hypothetical protein